MKEKKKLIITTIIVLIMMIATIGLTYAMFIYNATGENSKLVLGDIWMKYTESEGISLQNAMPGDPYSDYFEFTITGTNTYEEKDIWYDIILSNGDKPDDKLEENRIDSKYLKFKLVEVISETEEKVLFVDKTYNDLNNRRVYVSTIPKNTTSEYNKTYRMYMTLSEKLEIGNTSTSVMTMEDFENVFASVKVSVTGDFNTKQMPGTMARLGTNGFWEDSINNVKSNIKEVNFIQLDNSEIDTRYNAASIKSDVTTVEEYPIKAWLEPNATDSTKYTMYVASEEEIYFPSASANMFTSFSAVENFNFANIDTSQAIDMWGMFARCNILPNLDLTNFDTSQVTLLGAMFYECSNLTEIKGIENFDVSQVTRLPGMFYGCKSLTSLDLSDWDTGQVTDMYTLFNNCTKLAEIKGIEDFNTSNVTNFDQIFEGCPNLTSLDLSNWNTSNVNSMVQVFKDCSNLKTLNINGWNISSVANIGSMFSGCKNLTSLDLSNWDMSNVRGAYATFQYVSSATEIKLSNNITLIDDFMFNHNYAHTGDTFTIPASVTTIGKTHMWYAFGTTFKEFVVEDGNTNFKTIDGILYTMDGTRLVSVPTHKTFENRTYEMPEGVTFIGETNFSLNKNIDTLILPNSYVITRYVGTKNASYNKRNVNYGNSLSIGIYYRTNIGSYEVKSDNPNYTSVDGCIYSKDGSELIAVPWQYNGALSIKEGTTKIGQEAFWTQGASSSETTKLTSVHIPASVTTIESSQLTALNKLVGRITITIDSNNPNYIISSGKIVSK